MLSNQKIKMMFVAVICGFMGASASYAFQHSGSTNGGSLPESVKTAADAYFGGTNYNHRTTTEDGETYFRCIGKKNGLRNEVLFTESADQVQVRTPVSNDKLPAAALSSLRHEFSDLKVTDVDQVTRMWYAVTFRSAGHEYEVFMFPNGHYWHKQDADKDRGDDHDKDKDKTKK